MKTMRAITEFLFKHKAHGEHFITRTSVNPDLKLVTNVMICGQSEPVDLDFDNYYQAMQIVDHYNDWMHQPEEFWQSPFIQDVLDRPELYGFKNKNAAIRSIKKHGGTV